MKQNKIYHIVFLVALLCVFAHLNGQNNILEEEITLQEAEYKLRDILTILFETNSINLSYSNKEIPLDLMVQFNRKKQSLETILDEISRQAGIEYSLSNEMIIIKPKKSLQKYTISGTIKDKNSGETLPYTNVAVLNKQKGTVSNKFGFYSITLTKGVHTLTHFADLPL